MESSQSPPPPPSLSASDQTAGKDSEAQLRERLIQRTRLMWKGGGGESETTSSPLPGSDTEPKVCLYIYICTVAGMYRAFFSGGGDGTRY